METKLHNFLTSNLLNKYLVGKTTDAETAEVEYYILNYPEAAKAWQELQNNLEILAKADAIEAPKAILDTVFTTINPSQPKVVKLAQTNRTWYSIAASVAAVFFAISSFFLYQRNKELNNENNVVVDEIFDLRDDIEKNNLKLDELSKQIEKLNDPDAKKYVLFGNERAKDLKTVAYINPVDKTSMIDIITLPQLPQEQYYQIWAELQGKMVNLGILDEKDKSKLKPIPYMEDASALSITIETRGDNSSSNANEVAEISLKE